MCVKKERIMILSQSCSTEPIDLYLILDESGSVSTVFKKERQLASDIVKQIPSNDFASRVAIGMVTFSRSATQQFKLATGKSRDEVTSQIEAIDNVGGSTSAVAGVTLAVQDILSAKRDGAKLIVVHISDGNSQDIWDSARSAAKKLQDTGAEVYAVTLSSDYVKDELLIYAGDEERVYVGAKSNQLLPDLKNLTVGETCLIPETTTVPQPSPPPATDGPAPTTAAPRALVTSGSCPVDIMFILDTSGSVEDDFKKQREFMSNLMSQMPADDFVDRLRVAVVAFYSKATVASKFGDVIEKDDVVAMIKGIAYTGGATSSPSALRLATQEINRGRRAGATLLVLHVSDGNSQDPIENVLRDAATLRATGAIVFAQTFSADAYYPELNGITDDETRIYAENEKNAEFINDIQNTANSDFCNPTVPTETPVEATTTTPTPEVTTPRVLVTSGSCPVDIMFILDTSGSVEDDFKKQREFMSNLMSQMPADDFVERLRVAVVSFYSKAMVASKFGDVIQKDDVVAMIKGIAYTGGATSSPSALRLATQEIDRGRRAGATLLVLHVSDGNSQDPIENVLRDAATLRATGAIVFAQTFSADAYYPELNGITDDETRVYAENEKNAEFINDIKNTANSDLCNPKTTTQAPVKPTQTPVIDFKMDKCQVDVFVMLDTSGSIADAYTKERNFIADTFDLTTSSQYDNGNVAVSVVSFYSQAKIALEYQQGRSKQQVLDSVRSIPFTGGGTSAISAVTLTVQQIQKNRRPKADLVVLLVSDGNSGATDTFDRVDVAAKSLLALGGKVYAVTFSRDFYMGELKTYTGNEKQVYAGPRSDLFQSEFSAIVNIDEAACGVVAVPDVPKPQPQPTEAPVVPVVTQAPCGKLDLMIILDTSGSVTSDFEKQREVAISVVEKIPAADFSTRVVVAATSFSKTAVLELEFGDESAKEGVVDKLKSIQQVGGKTSTVLGVQKAIKQMQKNGRSDARAVAVLVSDGQGQDEWDDVISTAASLQATGATTYAVTLSQIYYLPELALYAGSEDRVYTSSRISDFFKKMEAETSAQCSRRK